MENEQFCRQFLKKLEGKRLEEIILESNGGNVFVYKGFYRESNQTKKITDREPKPALPISDYWALSRKAGYLMGILAGVGIDTVRDKEGEIKNCQVRIPIYIVPEGERQEYKPLTLNH
jgi:hypothetical protein